MKDWLQSQGWSEELWVAVLVFGVVLFTILASTYKNHVKH
jgi:hypothetical protein